MIADLIRNKVRNLLGLLLVRFCVEKLGMLCPETFGSQSRANHIKPVKGDFFFIVTAGMPQFYIFKQVRCT